MHTKVDDVHTLDELRQFVHKTLCEKENLLADQFTMTEVRLTRGNGPCGLQFCLRGPRNVRLAAIWVADRNVVYLYDASRDALRQAAAQERAGDAGQWTRGIGRGHYSRLAVRGQAAGVPPIAGSALFSAYGWSRRAAARRSIALSRGSSGNAEPVTSAWASRYR